MERGKVHRDALPWAGLRLPHSLVSNEHIHVHDDVHDNVHDDDNSAWHYHIRNMIRASDSPAAKDAASIYYPGKCILYHTIYGTIYPILPQYILYVTNNMYIYMYIHILFNIDF